VLLACARKLQPLHHGGFAATAAASLHNHQNQTQHWMFAQVDM
jgi:hypothetical protein